jgi:hypothetical protein
MTARGSARRGGIHAACRNGRVHIVNRFDDVSTSADSGDEVKPDDPRTRLLECAGFQYNRAAGCWIHRIAGRVISQETVEGHDLAWLKGWLAWRHACGMPDPVQSSTYATLEV